jgi:hypothetical protein
VSYRSVFAVPGAALVALSVPASAALVLPDLSPQVLDGARADLGTGAQPWLVRAAGLTFPALAITVPAAAVAARRFRVRAVLFAGLALLVAGLAAVRYGETLQLVCAGRIAQGIGAGIALPASAVLVWETRSRLPVALWAASLAAGLLGAMPLALHLVRAGGDWRVALAPSPWLALVALGALLPCLLWRGERLPAAKSAERAQLVMPIVPAAGVAFLAAVAVYQWSPGAQLVVACIALLAVCGPALAAAGDATAGSANGGAVVMVSVGLLAFPLAGPLAGLVASDGGLPPVPFAAGAAAALAGALTAAALPRRTGRALVLTGHLLILLAVAAALATGAADQPAALIAVLVPLGLGAGTALSASLRDAGAGAVLFGLGLCFPAVLTGQLLVLSLQAGRWLQARPTDAAQQLAALTDGYRIWLVVAGVLAVLLALAARRGGPDRPDAPCRPDRPDAHRGPDRPDAPRGKGDQHSGEAAGNDAEGVREPLSG